MNFNLTQIPERTQRPRTSGLTMVMDKGLSINEVKNFLEVAGPHVDIVKLGFGTSYVTPRLREKIDIYRENNMPIYFGGTLFEAFLIRNFLPMLQDFFRLLMRQRSKNALRIYLLTSLAMNIKFFIV